MNGAELTTGLRAALMNAYLVADQFKKVDAMSSRGGLSIGRRDEVDVSALFDLARELADAVDKIREETKE